MKPIWINKVREKQDKSGGIVSPPGNPDNEKLTERKRLKSPYLCGFQDLAERRKLYLYIKLTSNGAGFCAEMKIA